MDKLSAKHLFFVILGLDIVSLKTYPMILFKTGGTDTWIAVIVASAFILLFSYYIFNISVKHQEFDLSKIYNASVGNFLGKFLFVLLVITLYLTLIESSSIEANALHTNLLYETPPWFFIIFLILPAIYTLRKGKIAIIMITVIGIILIIFAGINLSLLTAKYKNYSYLFPVMQNGISPSFIDVLIKILGLYGFIFIALPFARDIENKAQINKIVIISMIVVIQMEILSIVGIISTFGISRASLISYPKLIQTQQVSYFGFLESGEFFVMLQIVGGWYIKYILVFYSLLVLIRKTINTNKYFPFIISFLVAIPSFYISRNIIMLFNVLNYFSYICFFNLILIPLIIFTIYKIKYLSKIQS